MHFRLTSERNEMIYLFLFVSQSFALMSDRQRKRKLQESLAPESKLMKDNASAKDLYTLCSMWESGTV